MRALVTGAAGFAGSHLADHLLRSGDKVIAFLHPNDSDAHLLPHAGRIEMAPGDVCDDKRCSEVVATARPDVVYHLAGVAFVPILDDPPGRMMSVNLGGALNMIEAVRRHAPDARFVLAGSAEVYGQAPDEDLPATEKTPLRPASLYAHSKLFAESLVDFYRERFGVRGVTLRLFNHIGPRQSVKFAISSFAQQIRAIREGRTAPLIRVGNLDARRDFTDVRDVARAYRFAATAETKHHVFNICSGTDISIRAVLEKLIEISGVRVEIRTDPERLRPLDVPRYLGTYERARRELGWTPEIGMTTTLEDILKTPPAP